VLASQAAIEMLRDGGNAVDAAVAAAGVLGVTEPFSCGIGGGGFMVIRTPDGKVTTIDSREKSPRAMRPDSFIEDGRPLSFNDARFSGLSAGVPGTPLGWARALRLYGTVSLEEALEPGIRVARRGFTVDQTFFDQVDAAKDYFDDVPSTRALYLDPDGSPRTSGRRSATRTWRARTSGWPTAACAAASTAARSHRRWSNAAQRPPIAPRPTTRGGPA
jgi:gamma-glutamyltranspeptidase/glutathione hydrolase